MKTGRHWWTPNRPERIWTQRPDGYLPPSSRRDGDASCQRWLHQAEANKKKELLLCLGVTLWHTSLKCERDGNAVWRLECRSCCPSVGKSDSRVPTPGRCTCRDRRGGRDVGSESLRECVKHNRSLAAPDQRLLQHRNRPLLSTLVISAQEHLHITIHPHVGWAPVAERWLK